ncbi:MAG: hypothetical protein AAFY56_12630, partial [Pseudomonadota bacterium]
LKSAGLLGGRPNGSLSKPILPSLFHTCCEFQTIVNGGNPVETGPSWRSMLLIGKGFADHVGGARPQAITRPDN